jgi:hypothetical protein
MIAVGMMIRGLVRRVCGGRQVRENNKRLSLPIIFVGERQC